MIIGIQSDTIATSSQKLDEVVEYFVQKNFSVKVIEDPYKKKVRTEKGKNDNWESNTDKVVVKKDYDEDDCRQPSTA